MYILIYQTRSADESSRGEVLEVLDGAVLLGLTVLRAWVRRVWVLRAWVK